LSVQFINNNGQVLANGIRVGTSDVYRAVWTPTQANTFNVAVRATDSAGGSTTSAATRRVVVSNVIGIAPTVTIAVPGTVTTASTSNFTATATDSDGSVIGVEFYLNRNSIGQAVRDQQTNTWRLTAAYAGIAPGNIEVVALARDSSGNVAASTTTNITLNAASSIAPSITITPSTTNAAFNRQVQLTANARDTDGTVTSVQYFANATSIGTSGNPGSNFQVNWTPTQSGPFNIWAIATDSSGITRVSPTVIVTVRRNNPVQEDAAFILQTYQDIANTTNINPLLFADLDAQLGAGTLTRADVVMTLLDEPGFVAPVNLLAAYYAIMGQWPTPQNYTTLLGIARGSLSNAIGAIITSNEYLLKYEVTPTTALLNNPASVIPATLFEQRLWAGAGLGSPSAAADVAFRNNNVLSATLGRGYNVVGVNTAVAEFITNTNSTNTALFRKARAAALYYQLDRPPITVTTDQIATRVNQLAQMTDDKAVATAVLADILYTYRYVTILKNPDSLVVSPRSGAIFRVEALGAPPLAYQWLLNGAPIPGATSPVLSLTNVDASRVGTYTVVVTSSANTATSDPATLTLTNAVTRLANISTRGVTTGGANVLIGGFVVTGTAANQTRQVLVRVVGPTLGAAPFNVANTLPNPRLEIYSGGNPTPVVQNDDWGNQQGGAQAVTALQQATTRAGAFNLPNNSNDAAVLATLPPGNYTVQAKGPNANASGVVLIEVYDVTQGGAAGAKAANVSTRGDVGTGGNILIAGFVVNGTASRRILVRGVGPTLQAFGLPANALLANPQLSLVDQATGTIIRTNDDWATSDDAGVIAAAAVSSGAFALANGSRDAAMIVMLPPGAYTAQLSGVGNTTGIGIVEVYDVDP
ncbi:MAG TPA: Ig-like domain-containing protein, partial [Opitutaceae bacterium]|nr:Ig-like domain-containing protein [Opitutaceae bacterium]